MVLCHFRIYTAENHPLLNSKSNTFYIYSAELFMRILLFIHFLNNTPKIVIRNIRNKRSNCIGFISGQSSGCRKEILCRAMD